MVKMGNMVTLELFIYLHTKMIHAIHDVGKHELNHQQSISHHELFDGTTKKNH